MSHIVIATEDDELHAQVALPLAGSGHAVQSATTWDGLLRSACTPGCTMVLVDSQLPGLDPVLLSDLTLSVSHRPTVRVLRGKAPPLKKASTRQDLLLGQARRLTPSSLDHHWRSELTRMGLGHRPLPRLARIATHKVPVRLEGEPGTNKEGVARALHALSASQGPFLKVERNRPAEITGPMGSLYIKNVDQWSEEELDSLLQRAAAADWRVITGSRTSGANQDTDRPWTVLKMAPLRKRPSDVKGLARLYIEKYRLRLGLTRRRFGASLWTRMQAHTWPRNAKELEAFVVQVLTSTESALINESDLSPRVRSLLEADEDAEVAALASGFESMVESRLGSLVRQYRIDSDLGLYRLVMDATERSLIRLALARTGGNQKAAASLLGLARNTLRTKGHHLGLLGG
jgi:DNA-binding NtrC family response regulator